MIRLTAILAFISIALLIQSVRAKMAAKAKLALPKKVKADYPFISVNAQQCKVLTNTYSEEEEKELDRVSVADALYAPNRNVVLTTKFASVILCENVPVKGSVHRFHSRTIELPEQAIQKKLSENKQVNIYYNPLNLKEHYFELDFLAEL